MSEIIQSSAKRHPRELNSVNEAFIRLGRTPVIYELIFSHHYMEGLVDLQHYALVITFQITNCKLRRFLSITAARQ